MGSGRPTSTQNTSLLGTKRAGSLVLYAAMAIRNSCSQQHSKHAAHNLISILPQPSQEFTPIVLLITCCPESRVLVSRKWSHCLNNLGILVRYPQPSRNVKHECFEGINLREPQVVASSLCRCH